MLTVLTAAASRLNRNVLQRVGFGHTNQPEKRCSVILETLLRRGEEEGMAHAALASTSIETAKSLLKKFHDTDYLDFLQGAHASLTSSGDANWSDATGALVPNHFSRTAPSKEVPLYKHSGFYCGDFMTPVRDDSFQSAVDAAMVCVRAAELVIPVNPAGPAGIVYALVDSPGHHAKYDQYNGYCFFANAVIAAKTMIDGSCGRISCVSILDLDYHAGNGTANLVRTHPYMVNMQAVSIHASPERDYPSFEGYESDNDAYLVHNICLAPGSTWTEYEIALSDAIDQVIACKPGGLVIAFGGDTYKLDPDASPAARFALDIPDYRKMGEAIRRRLGGLPTVVTQEGGYHMEDIGAIVDSFFAGLLSWHHRPDIL
jgi:acetoin utilization deacetylase AcuC-like enzyme